MSTLYQQYIYTIWELKKNKRYLFEFIDLYKWALVNGLIFVDCSCFFCFLHVNRRYRSFLLDPDLRRMKLALSIHSTDINWYVYPNQNNSMTVLGGSNSFFFSQPYLGGWSRLGWSQLTLLYLSIFEVSIAPTSAGGSMTAFAPRASCNLIRSWPRKLSCWTAEESHPEGWSRPSVGIDIYFCQGFLVSGGRAQIGCGMIQIYGSRVWLEDLGTS